MAWHLGALTWLAHAAVGGSLFLAAGCLAAALCRQPVRRILVIELALAGALLVPWAAALPCLPHWSAGWLDLAPPAADPEPAATLAVFTESSPPQLAIAAGAREEAPTPAPSVGKLPAADFHDEAPAAMPPAPAVRVVSLPAAVLIVYGLGAGLLLAGGLLGLLRLGWLWRTAYPVPPEVDELFRDIAGPAGRGVRLLASDRIALPLMFAAWRPVVLLPGALCRSGDRDALRYCLAHEWSHVERRDAWRWYLAGLAGLVFFYQPLFWWLRRQLRLCQDYLADARAAACAARAEDYAAYLVALARGRRAVPAAALGIGDRRSNLYRRVLMLLCTREPLQRRCLAAFWAASLVGAAGLLVALATVRLDARAADAPKPAPKETARKEAEKGETLHYTGKVVEKETGKPIAGAVVTVRRSLLGDPELKERKPVLQETKHTTDAQGKYSFVIPPEQSSQRYLYIELDVEHPDYPAQKGFGYALGMIRKNEKMGGRPFFELVELRQGKPITGTVVAPDGKPLAGVRVLAFSVTDKRGEEFQNFSFADGRTDAAGKFRIVITTPGRGVFWILPDDYAPSTHAVPVGKRGDLGTFTAREGIRLHGKVVDTKGRPMAGVFVNVEKRGQSEELQGLPVADSINRTGLSDAKGEFATRPLPPGEYRVLPADHAREYRGRNYEQRPLAEVFLPQKLVLRAGVEPGPVEVRAVPHVVIEAQYYDGKGKPTRGHAPHVFGQLGQEYWFQEATADGKGKVTVRVPHGLEKVQLGLSTNEHGSLRWRKAHGAPLNNTHEIQLGTLNDDVKGIEIVRYVAPIVVVNVKAANGAKLKEPAVTALYPKGKGPYGGRLVMSNGKETDISFEHQEDGRFRSEQMLPDEEVTVTAQAEGYAPKSVKVKLPEGEKKEIEITLDTPATPAPKKGR
jgi:uncharacterized GH25 family protein